MRLRRLEDREPGLLLARPTGWISGDDFSLRRAGGTRALARPEGAAEPVRTARCAGRDLLLLLDVDGDDGLLVAGSATYCVPRGDGDDEALFDHAARGAARLREERLRLEKRQKLPDQLIAYFHELNAATGEDDVLCALSAHALRIVGGHTALPLVRDGRRGMLRAPVAPAHADDAHRAAVLWDDRYARPGLVLAEDARRGGSAPDAAPFFGDPSTAMMAHVPIGEDGAEGVLVLTERREERIFLPEDWDVLRALALQAEMAIKRVRLIESVRSLSLTDPLTGLANRRHMEVVLEHAWAAARRGEPLAVLALDLDGFKQVNDRDGHQAGDRLLCRVAEALRDEARRSDVAVRYGGDEFLVILPGGDEGGARALVERLRRRLGDAVEISDGVAVYGPAHATPDDLIREADRRLYETKHRRCALAGTLN